MLLLLLATRYRKQIKILTLIPLYSSIEIKLVEMNYIKVKQSRNRPGVAQRVPGGFRLQDFHETLHIKVVRLSASRTGRLQHRKCSWYSFSLGAESTPGPWYSRKEICH